MTTDATLRPDAGDPTAADMDRLRERYRTERDRRIRTDGTAQYRTATGDFGFYADDPWSPPGDREPVHDHVDALVVGGGFGGLVAAARLREAGLERIRIVDVAGDLGGTWYWNRYPGIACDIESSIYLPLLEEIGGMPSRKYPPGEEIRGHARAIGERFDLYTDALFGTEVTSLTWDDAGHWDVRTDRGDAVTARFVVISSGPFNRPKLPGIPGIEDFAGHTFHTSRWDFAYTGGDATSGLDRIGGKRIAVIGTGATAIQCVPHLAEGAAHLYVVQRTPSCVDVRDDAPYDAQWWSSLEPGWQRRRREDFLHLMNMLPPRHGGAGDDGVADRWTDTAPIRGVARYARTHGTESLADALEIADAEKMDEIRARVDTVVDDPATADALKPWYRQMCKRPTFSDRYLQAFNRDDVTLLDTGGQGVEKITPAGLVVDGTEYPVDAIVFATGFELGADPATRAGADVRGRDGLALGEKWADGLSTLHGWVSRGFPNLFHVGALQNSASVNFTHVLEEQATHIAAVVAEAGRRGATAVEPTAGAEDAWVATIRDRAVDQQGFLAECTPGYYNFEGRPRKRNEQFGGGPVEFHEILHAWRDSGMDDVFEGPR
ncbi:Cyclohexanone monooxygenase [Pseudonocardia sp. Ae168_Ps1]|uniref:flavin-containing monooxygenase n=1 Tax=unclassified Pseudonocardia TaxID=2619320 RepID=UPI00094AA03C|nr:MULTISPECIES: NAD(P)/FAD-dependent oxidoreductase [unclassified Pseudonocardia]OLL76917.1 Cyclohexanone monooxygenase [Pseudonocardia sp. Ae150A_Ps1]OLL82933.1 Cyclohexanone monooxygenase [Pseudonocardia sp. Ae168_Ps1]OLL82958.1 Cyclohexanone monooxygenase [Pseudonocardia sp. Ae263_Ps1]OLL91004.1 Cyclohexanone monooxygenase [Pseudonocardia sp. Ae356_Ps1]